MPGTGPGPPTAEGRTQGTAASTSKRCGNLRHLRAARATTSAAWLTDTPLAGTEDTEPDDRRTASRSDGAAVSRTDSAIGAS